MNNETNNVNGQIDNQVQTGASMPSEANFASQQPEVASVGLAGASGQVVNPGPVVNPVPENTNVSVEVPVMQSAPEVPVAPVNQVPVEPTVVNPNVVPNTDASTPAMPNVMPVEDANGMSVAAQMPLGDAITVAPAPVNQSVQMGAQDGFGDIKPKKKSSLGVILIVVIVLAVLGVGGYFVYTKFLKKPAPTPVAPEKPDNEEKESEEKESEQKDAVQYMGFDFKIPEGYSAELKDNKLVYKSEHKMFVINFYDDNDWKLIGPFSDFYKTSVDTLAADNYTFYVFNYMHDGKTLMPFVVKTDDEHYGIGGICATNSYTYDPTILEDIAKIFELNNSANFKGENKINETNPATYDFVEDAINAFKE